MPPFGTEDALDKEMWIHEIKPFEEANNAKVAIEPFDSYLTQADKDNFLYLDKGLVNGKQYALPIIVGSARVMYYNKEMDTKPATFMLNGNSMTEFHKLAAFPPVGKDETYNNNPIFKELYENNKEALVPAPEVKGATAIYDNLYKNLQLMMLGEITAEKALADAAKYADDALAQNQVNQTKCRRKHRITGCGGIFVTEKR